MMSARARRGWIAGGAAAVAIALIAAAVAWRTPAPAVDASAKRQAAARVVAQAQVVPIDGIIEVRPLAQGKVLRVLVQPGDHVVADQLLAEIENDLESATIRQRRAEVAAAAARLSLTREGVRSEEQAALSAAAVAAKHDANLARDRWQRQRALLAKGFVSKQAVSEAASTLRAAEARAQEATLRARAGQAGGRAGEVRAARESVNTANAALSQGEVALSRTRIVAPIKGIIMERNVNPGDIIGSNVTAPTLLRIVDPARVEIRFEVEELLAPRIEVGQPVDFVLPGSKTILGHGKVTRLAPQVQKRAIGADDARIRADSMVRPAWSNFSAQAGTPPLPVNYRLEAWVHVKPQKGYADAGSRMPAER